MPRLRRLALAGAIILLTGCASYYGLEEAETGPMENCVFVGTFAETANPGREDGGVLKHYVDTTGVRHRVLRRAARAGATHVVWMHTYSMAAAAQAYRCPNPCPASATAVGPPARGSETLVRLHRQ